MRILPPAARRFRRRGRCRSHALCGLWHRPCRLGYDAPAPLNQQRSGSAAQRVELCTPGFGGWAMKKTLGSYLIELLEAQGVQHVFGIPGVHNLELYRGLASSRIRHVTGRHEQGLGFMADGYARVSGRPGVCFTITGPGLSNIATALGQAYADSIPLF